MQGEQAASTPTAHLRTALHRVFGAHVTLEERADDEVHRDCRVGRASWKGRRSMQSARHGLHAPCDRRIPAPSPVAPRYLSRKSCRVRGGVCSRGHGHTECGLEMMAGRPTGAHSKGPRKTQPAVQTVCHAHCWHKLQAAHPCFVVNALGARTCTMPKCHCLPSTRAWCWMTSRKEECTSSPSRAMPR